MVAGHSACPTLLSKFIYFFHMPLFFFCSGYFFTQPTNVNSLIQYICRRIKGLYLPFITWNFFFLLCHNFLIYLHIYYHEETYIYHTDDYATKLYYIIFTMSEQEPIVFQLWFLKQLFLSSCITCLFSYILAKKSIIINHLWGMCMLITITIFLKYINFVIPVIGDISIVLLSIIFFYMGFIYKQRFYKVTHNLIRGGICAVILILLAWLCHSKIEMLNYTYKNIPIFICSAQIGIYMVICFAKNLEKYTIRKILYYIGNHTMVVFIWHLLSFRLASIIKTAIWDYPIERIGDIALISEHNQFFWIIYTLIGCAIPLLLYFLIYDFPSKFVTINNTD